MHPAIIIAITAAVCLAVFGSAGFLLGYSQRKRLAEAAIGSAELEAKLDEFGVHIVILTLPKEHAEEVMERLSKTRVRGVWNFTGKDLNEKQNGMAMENVHIGDSLMALCYEIAKELD